jgi:acyl carrier protein
MDAEFRDKLTQVFLDSIAETQQRSGREVQVMTEETIPFTDLVNFDSHSGVEVEVLLSNRLGFEIEDIPFCEGRHGSRELRVSEIVNALVKKYGAAIPKALKSGREQLVTN